jgi:SAM-dependent methyltransferase
MKIERLLDLDTRSQPMRMLEIGTGSGGIAHYFGTHPGMEMSVDAVDVVDNRLVSDNYRFTLVNDTRLPFADGTFDVVLTNHVIEHVGDGSAQLAHLSEVGRVLKKDGVGYLAVPNRWQIVEPHYKLPFLSWWPHAWRSAYLRLMRKGRFYDCEPLTLSELDLVIANAGLVGRHMEIEALTVMVELENTSDRMARFAKHLPYGLLARFRSLIPTLICRIEHPRT